eukprot:scaffold223354_cov19-Tisochrysis_lutea.AAC.1
MPASSRWLPSARPSQCRAVPRMVALPRAFNEPPLDVLALQLPILCFVLRCAVLLPGGSPDEQLRGCPGTQMPTDVLVPATFQLGTDADKRISSKYTPIKGNQAPLAATDLMFRATEGAAHDSQGTDSQAAGFVARGGYDDGAGDGGDLRAVDQDAAAAYQRYNPLHAPASGPGGGLLKKPCKHVLSSA